MKQAVYRTIGKKIIAFTTLILFVMSLISTSYGEVAKADFYDIQGHWAKAAIETLIAKGIIQGSPQNGVLEVRPNASISRAEFVTIVVRAFNLKAVTGNMKSFNDEIKGAWYNEALKTAASNSLLAGYPDGGFHPNDPVTNEQVSIILVRLRNQQLKPVGQKIDSSWYVTNVLAASRDEFAKVPMDAFTPKEHATRAEMMMAMYSFLKAKEKADSKAVAQNSDQNPDGGSNIIGYTGSGSGSVSTGTGVSSGSGTGSNTNNDGSVNNGAGNVAPEPAKTGVVGYDITAAGGDTVYFQVFAYLLTELGGFDFKLTYDPEVVVATSVRNGSIKKDTYIDQKDIDLSRAGEGVVYVKSQDTSAISGSDGTLFTVVFRVQPGAAGSSAITMTSGSGGSPRLYNQSGGLITPVTFTEGKISVK